MKPVAYLVTLPPGRIPAQSVLIDAARASDYAAQHHGSVDGLVLEREATAIWNVMMRQAMLLGELSKGLDADDPLMAELKQCGQAMDAASNIVDLVWTAPESPLYKLNGSIVDCIVECPVTDVMAVLMGHFVGLSVELARRSGHDSNLPITIDGGTSRDVTIHAQKQPETLTAKVAS